MLTLSTLSRVSLLLVAAALLTGSACNLHAQKAPVGSPTITAAIPTVNLFRVPEGGLEPQLVARDGVLHLIYYRGAAENGDIFYVRSQDGGQNWSTPLRVNSQADSAIAVGAIRGAHLSAGRKGRAYVVWNGSDKATPRNAFAPPAQQQYGAAPLLFARLNDAGTAFEPQRDLMTRSFSLDGGASVASDEQGRVYVAWHANTEDGQDEGGRQVLLAVSGDDGKTFSPEVPVWKEPTGACGCCQLRLMTAGEQLSLLYRSARQTVHRDTYYLVSNDHGRTFQGTKVQEWKIGACPMSSFALALDGTQTLGAWESQGSVHFASLTPDAAPDRITDAPRGANQKYPALAVNAGGQTLLAWTEGTGWGRGGQLCWQVYAPDGTPLPDASGKRDGVPAWSFPAATALPDGSFKILY